MFFGFSSETPEALPKKFRRKPEERVAETLGKVKGER